MMLLSGEMDVFKLVLSMPCAYDVKMNLLTAQKKRN